MWAMAPWIELLWKRGDHAVKGRPPSRSSSKASSSYTFASATVASLTITPSIPSLRVKVPACPAACTITSVRA